MSPVKFARPIAEKKIAALERVRQEFVANVSHELRTPLTVIRGYLEILVDSKQDALSSWQGIFEKMFAQSLRMEQLISDLLFLSRLEIDSPNLAEQTSCDVAKLLAMIVEEAKALSADKKHVFQLTADETLQLTANYDELRSAFSNIIFNAVTYTPHHGQIRINWSTDAAHCPRLCVADNGIGIASGDIPRLTERFYRVDKARSRDNGGTGLGLAIVKHVLLRHQGTLEIQSILGKGSTFMCVFPAHRLSSTNCH